MVRGRDAMAAVRDQHHRERDEVPVINISMQPDEQHCPWPLRHQHLHVGQEDEEDYSP